MKIDLNDLKYFRHWLQLRMHQYRMSQRALALDTGIDHSTISRILRGTRSPQLSTAVSCWSILRMSERRMKPEPGGDEFHFGKYCGIHCGKYVRKQHKIGHCYTCHNLKMDKEKLGQAFATHRTDKVHR